MGGRETSSVSPLRYSHELLEVPPNSFVHTSLGFRREPVREVNSTRRTAPRGRMRPGLDVVVLAGVDEVLLVVRRR